MSTRLGGRYQLIRELGAGGMGRVFQAVDTETGRSVAAKIMLAGGEDNLDSLLRFYQEGALLSTLRHPNIVEVYGTFLEEHTCWIIMELLEGQSLSQLLRSEGQLHRPGEPQGLEQPQGLPRQRVKLIVQQVASALAFAHSRGIVHRDIKPDNIMLLSGDHVKVTDFGIARVNRSGATLQTVQGLAFGTPLYMAPEQIEGHKVDGRADIYSLGAVLYQMVAGHPPFEGDDPLTVAFKHVHRAPQPPHELNEDVPPDWEALILKMLAKDPAARFQTAAALEEAIAALSAGGQSAALTTPPHLPPGPPPTEAPSSSPRSPEPVSTSPTGALHPEPSTIPAPAAAAPTNPTPPESTPVEAGYPPGAIVDSAPVDTAAAAKGRGDTGGPPSADTAVDRTVAAKRWPVPWPVLAGGLAVLLIALLAAFLLTRPSPPTPTAVPTATPHRGSIATPAPIAPLPYKVLAQWGTQGAGPGHFSDPQAIALDPHGNIYVADTGNSRIQKFSPAGVFLMQWGTPGAELAQFDHPAGVAVDGQGNVYVADTGNNRIQKFSSAGKLLSVWGLQGSNSGQFDRPTGIALDAQGNIYVADTGNDRVETLSPSGKDRGDWGTPGSGPLQFHGPTGVAVDSQGNVFVADRGNNRIQELAPTSDPIAQWGARGTGLGHFVRPTGVALDAQGNIYAADSGNGRIEKLSSTGKPLGASARGRFQNPAAIAIGSQGGVFIVETGRDHILKIAFTR